MASHGFLKFFFLTQEAGKGGDGGRGKRFELSPKGISEKIRMTNSVFFYQENQRLDTHAPFRKRRRKYIQKAVFLQHHREHQHQQKDGRCYNIASKSIP